MDTLLLLLNDAFFSAIPAMGFAMLFNVPRRYLLYCALAGAIGHSSRTLMLQFGLPIEWATFAAAGIIGMVTIAFAKRHLAPPLLYAVAAIIPMIRALCLQHCDCPGAIDRPVTAQYRAVGTGGHQWPENRVYSRGFICRSGHAQPVVFPYPSGDLIQ